MINPTAFYEKNNKVDGKVYVIEEQITMPAGGIYDAELQHDNINESSLTVYTGPVLTGDRIQTYALSTPSLMPWKRIIRIQTSAPTVYICYETDGDTVEAADINRLQAAVTGTEKALNAEEIRAGAAEKKLTEDLRTECERAVQEESYLSNRIDTEVDRAEYVEEELQEQIRAESDRATAAEGILTDSLSAEIARAKAAEVENADKLATEVARAGSAEEAIRTTLSTNKPVWDDKYTRNEVDNKFSSLETAIDWKEAVPTYADLATTYPRPDDGWTVNVRDTDYTYRWSGTEWVAISANSIPKATQDVDGLLTKEDKIAYDDTVAKKHIHSNKSVLDKITQVMLDNLSTAYAHISDAVRHITAAERTNWAEAYSRRHDHSNKTIIDKITQAMLDKLTGIAPGAEVNVQPDWSVSDTASDAYVKNKPTKVSQFVNDAGYITADDVDTSQNHTHSNKSLLDGLTQALVDKWNSALTTLPAHKHVKADMTDFPVSLPANGGNSATVNGYSVNMSVPAGAKFTDTIYSHPNSGATAGTYRSVTMNAQGHVTAGSNPTTLAGYGITDAAAKTHNHDDTYLKKGAMVWNDMKGG